MAPLLHGTSAPCEVPKYGLLRYLRFTPRMSLRTWKERRTRRTSGREGADGPLPLPTPQKIPERPTDQTASVGLSKQPKTKHMDVWNTMCGQPE